MPITQSVARALERWTTSRNVCPELYCSSLATSIRCGDDPFHIRSYITGFDVPSSTLEELAAALQALEGEEELSGTFTTEGLLVQHASDGWFVLLVR